VFLGRMLASDVSTRGGSGVAAAPAAGIRFVDDPLFPALADIEAVVPVLYAQD